MTQQTQPGILLPVPRIARYLFWSIADQSDLVNAMSRLKEIANGDKIVVAIGASLVSALGHHVDGLTVMPARSENGQEIPSTPNALCCWLRGDDRGELVHLTRQLQSSLSPALQLDHVIDAFQYGESRDLSGYEDGTENPQGKDALKAAVVADGALAGSSFVAIQQWVHDLARFSAMKQTEKDHTFGRRLSDNEEIEDAPDSAHVKRTAQEDFEPEAFIVRRSMPWADARSEGLVFVAFGHSFAAFEALLNRMLGVDDGITDALFSFTQPVSGAYYWCPPMRDGVLDICLLGVK